MTALAPLLPRNRRSRDAWRSSLCSKLPKTRHNIVFDVLTHNATWQWVVCVTSNDQEDWHHTRKFLRWKGVESCDSTSTQHPEEARFGQVPLHLGRKARWQPTLNKFEGRLGPWKVWTFNTVLLLERVSRELTDARQNCGHFEEQLRIKETHVKDLTEDLANMTRENQVRAFYAYLHRLPC